jgi:hypothetical protein
MVQRMGVVEIMDKHLGTIIFVGMVLASLVAGGISTAMDTTTLDDALERKVVIEKFVDKANNVVCYWVKGEPKFTFACLQRRGLRQHNADVR